MPDSELDRLEDRLARLRDTAAAATRHRDPAATERRGRRRQRARQAGAAALTGLAVVAVVAVLAGRPAGSDQSQQPTLAQPGLADPGPLLPGPALPDPAPSAPSPPTPGQPGPAQPGPPAPPSTTGPDPAGQGELYDGRPPSGPMPASGGTFTSQGGLAFEVPYGWTVTPQPGCPGRGATPVIVTPKPGVAATPAGCRTPSVAFALIELRPAAGLPGASARVVAGHKVLVRPGPAEPGRFPVPPGWTVTTAVLPVPGGGVRLQVAEPGPGEPLFERILGSVTDL